MCLGWGESGLAMQQPLGSAQLYPKIMKFEFRLDQFPCLIHCLATQMFVVGSGERARLWELGARGMER